MMRDVAASEVITAWALDMWARYMANDAGELRRMLWYPDRSCGLSGGGAVTEDGWQDLEDECNSNIVTIVNRVVLDLPPAMRMAIEIEAGLMVAIVTVREGVLEDAKGRIYRALVAGGVA